MKKLFIFASIVYLLISCNNGNMENEPNPYPDGVYPFEVSNISHTENTDFGFEFVITWDNPADEDFRHVEYEIYGIADYPGEFQIYPDPDGYNKGAPAFFSSVLEKNRLTINIHIGNDQFVIIKCVDRFGNVSEGVRYDYHKY